VFAAIGKLRQQLGPADILVNSAGVGVGAYIHEMTEEIWTTGWDTNVKGACLAIQAVVPDMMERKQGLIINIGSMSGLVPGGPTGTVYVGGKWALMGISRSLSMELKPHNIRVTLLNPGTTDTPFRPKEYGKHPDWMQAEDVAAVVLFVATMREPISIHEVNFSRTKDGW
jgi:NADP-dependent 3-hydroxy acid dehydrogenase YdfG